MLWSLFITFFYIFATDKSTEAETFFTDKIISRILKYNHLHLKKKAVIVFLERQTKLTIRTKFQFE